MRASKLDAAVGGPFQCLFSPGLSSLRRCLHIPNTLYRRSLSSLRLCIRVAVSHTTTLSRIIRRMYAPHRHSLLLAYCLSLLRRPAFFPLQLLLFFRSCRSGECTLPLHGLLSSFHPSISRYLYLHSSTSALRFYLLSLVQ